MQLITYNFITNKFVSAEWSFMLYNRAAAYRIYHSSSFEEILVFQVVFMDKISVIVLYNNNFNIIFMLHCT